jgi:hypothetical protein
VMVGDGRCREVCEEVVRRHDNEELLVSCLHGKMFLCCFWIKDY